VIDYKGHATRAGPIMIGNLGAESKGQILGKYSFVNKTIQLWNHILIDAVGNLSCKPSNFRKRVR
jgi:hypothetical protein